MSQGSVLVDGVSPEQLELLGQRLGLAAQGGWAEALAQAPEPAEVARALTKIAQASGAPLAGAASAWLRLISLLSQGDYPCRVLSQAPWMVEPLLDRSQEPRHHEADELVEVLEQSLVGCDEAGALEALRRFKQQESLRLFLLEVEGRHSVRETTAGIADLAQACLKVCLRYAGVLCGAQEVAAKMAILGMGKLGGRELNYSSDVDLIMLCDDMIFAQPELRAKAESITRKLIALMEEVTAAGYVFRVDLRLRPEGARGLLVQCPDAMVDYYLSWGRTWERSAMLKARHVAGDASISARLLGALEPFLYRKYLDFQVIDELRAMKEMINRNAQLSAVMGIAGSGATAASPQSPAAQAPPAPKKGLGVMARLKHGRPAGVAAQPASAPASAPALDPSVPVSVEASRGWDVKIGVGGIREIEFFVQALQLVHCGTRAQLRVKNTLDALDRLLYAGLLSDKDHGALSDAYDFLRRVEHRVQMEHDRQTHRIPEDERGYARLARRLGYDAAAFHEEVTRHRRQVYAIFERLFKESAQQSQEPTLKELRSDALELVLAANAQTVLEPQVLSALSGAGFARPRQIAGQLRVLMEKDYGPYSARAGARERRLGEYLLSVSRASADPVKAFGFITRLITTVGDRPWFWRMLGDNPHATQLLVHVFSSSDYLAGMLMRDPNMIQRLMGASSAQVEVSAEELREQLDAYLEGIVDLEHRRVRIHRFYQEQILRLGLHAVASALPIEATTWQLTALADAVVLVVLGDVYAQLRARDAGLPPLEALPFAVVGMGKLGGGELGFGSDLDVIFVYEPAPEHGLDHSLYARLAQRLVRQLSALSEDGRLYEVDARLRPGGQKGTLVVSLDAFRAYYEESASVWELQALLRARPVCGPPSLARAILAVRHQRLFVQEMPADARAQISQMRQRMIEHQAPSRGVDVKTSPGGIIDLEFVVQWLQWSLGWGAPPHEADERGFVPGVWGQSTPQVMRALSHSTAMTSLGWWDGEALLDDYFMLRRVEAILRLERGRGEGGLPEDREELRALARRLGFAGEGAGAQLEATLARLMSRVRLVRERALDRVVGIHG